MTERMTCHECGVDLERRDSHALEDAFVTHVRAAHPDWPFPDIVLRNFAAARQRLSDDAERRATIDDVTIHPVTTDRIDDWRTFFDHDGFAGDPVNAVCYCSGTHLPTGERLELRPWAENRDFMVAQLRPGRVEGYLAYVEGRPAAWVNASRRSQCPILRCDADDDVVISVSCFLVAPPYRGHGLAAALLDRVIADASGRGASWIEACPSTTERNRGHAARFTSAGFAVREDRSGRAVVRRAVGR